MAAETFELVFELDGRKARAEAQRTGRSLDATGKSALAMGKAVAAAFVAVGAAQLVRDVVRVSSEFEQLRAQLRTIGAEDYFAEIARFATETPNSLQEVVRSFIGLKARGFEPTQEALRDIGNLGAAFGKSIEEAMQAVTQAAFGEAEMLKQYGIIMRQQGDIVTITYNGVTQTVEKNSQKIFDALTTISRENFGTAMAEQMGTFRGAVSNLNDSWEQLLDELGNGSGFMSEVLTASVQSATDAISTITEKLPVLGEFFRAAAADAATLKQRIDELYQSLNPLAGLFSEDALQSEALRQGLLGTIKAIESMTGLPLTSLLALTEKWRLEAEGAAKAAGDGAISIADMDRATRAALGPIKSMGSNLGNANAELQKMLKNLGDLQMVSNPWTGIIDMLLEFRRELARDPFEGLDTNALTDSLKPSAESFKEHLVERVAAAIIQGTDDGLGRSINTWHNFLDDVAATYGDRMATATSILGDFFADALQQAYFDGLDAGDLAPMMSQLGAQLGQAFAGPFGAAIGAILGDIIGDVLGRLLGSDDVKIIGQLDIGAGGAISQFGEGFADAAEHLNILLSQVEALIGSSVEIMGSAEVAITDAGEIWVTIRDEMGNIVEQMNGFGSLAEAAEYALVRLLNTAEFTGDIKLAYEEIIRNADDINDMISDLQFVGGLGRELDRLGGPAMRAKAAIKDVQSQFDLMRQEILALGLSAEAAAPLLDAVTRAETARMRELQAGVIMDLARNAEKFGVATDLSVKARVLEVKLQFLTLKMQLKMLGLWEQYGALWRELFRLSKQAARQEGREAAAAAGFARGSGAFMNFGTGTHAMLHGTEQVVTAKEGESIAGMVSRAMRAGQSSPQMLRELRGLRQDVQRNTRETRKMASRMQTSIGYAVARANAA